MPTNKSHANREKMNPNKLYMTEKFSNWDETVNNYFKEMKENGYGEFPPVLIYNLGGNHYVIDGNHRVKAARWASINWIPVEYANDSDLVKFGFTKESLETAQTW
jgi:ParB-like nuclease domain